MQITNIEKDASASTSLLRSSILPAPFLSVCPVNLSSKVSRPIWRRCFSHDQTRPDDDATTRFQARRWNRTSESRPPSFPLSSFLLLLFLSTSLSAVTPTHAGHETRFQVILSLSLSLFPENRITRDRPFSLVELKTESVNEPLQTIYDLSGSRFYSRARRLNANQRDKQKIFTLDQLSVKKTC